MAKSPATPRKPPHTTPAKHAAAPAANDTLPFAPHAAARFALDSEALPLHAGTTAAATPATIAQVQTAYAAPDKPSPSNALGDPTQNLQSFELTDLIPFTREAAYSTDASLDVHLFYAGRDNVHELLKYIVSRVTISLYLNMFGYDDSELNNILMQKALDPNITMLITLDKSQAGRCA